ncbi:MAG: DUF302 domain-containing protein [Lentimicrobiaceae bacterium]|nr:DUF302 domain-containing protein [Lentimicrobiaceae bacterium]
MKNIFILVFTLTSFILNAQTADMQPSKVMLEDESLYDFDKTVEKLTTAILDAGWKVTATLNLQETMAKNGKEVLPVKVIEVCNATHAYQILGDDRFREVAPMLPCRIAVYEKQHGKTYISRMNASAFASMVGGVAGETMQAAFNDTEAVLQEFIRK